MIVFTVTQFVAEVELLQYVHFETFLKLFKIPVNIVLN